MQTFLPYPDFAESAAVLDSKRLGKQRVEVMQILKALDGRTEIEAAKLGKKVGWVNHPATKMWRGYPVALVRYGMVVCTEWISRGYKDSCFGKISNFEWEGLFVRVPGTTPSPGIALTPECLPLWFGSEALHASHRSNLLRKDPELYRQYWPNDPDDLEYVWPVG